ncbi:L-histidine N(alpha)-methyltransferase [Lichenicoccus sp.]|uniref:L-histidine N(alpha)-methyltransferase n=1 Tax=Lichenicoccus sp. TaxID=2781899 RepID=UPI003D0A85C5
MPDQMAVSGSQRDLDLLNGAPSQRDADLMDIVSGLKARQKTLPTRLFYDEAGCELFRRITMLPEYHVTRAETALLDLHRDEITADVAHDTSLVEYGASDERKGVALIDAAPDAITTYVPIDIAGPALAALAARLETSHPTLRVQPVEADFTGPVSLPAAGGGGRLGFFPGSTIGNFDPPLVRRFLEQARSDLADGVRDAPVRFLIGTDLFRDRSELIPAYDDAAGVTAQFNKNILRHVNRITGAAFDTARFNHRAVWNQQAGRIEMHLVSTVAQVVEVAGHGVAFARGETIHTESSYKHTREGFTALANQAGWRAERFWTDPDGFFGLHGLLAA